jgi:SAM-dependent methyltransferase
MSKTIEKWSSTDNRPRDLKIKYHYEHWPFPDTDFLSREGLLLLRYFERWIKKKGKNPDKRLRVIDLGCGTGNTLLILAKNYPNVTFIGLDISEKSIQKACLQAERIKLSNVTFQKYDLREDLSSFGQFDVLLCLGVLHHIEEANNTFAHIARLISREAYVVLWLYGRLGRFANRVNQDFIQLLAKNSDKDKSLEIARAFLEELGPQYAEESGFYSPQGCGREGVDWLLEHPQWLADQLIPAYERGFTIHEIFSLFKENDIEFYRWMGIPAHLDRYTSSATLLKVFEELDPEEKLKAIDLLIKPSYYFVIGKKK